MRPFRFGVTLISVTSRQEWLSKCRAAEQMGYDVILVPDHLGAVAPFPAVVAAASATKRVRVGTLVLNARFYNPALLAREVASVDQLTDGRFELGLGAGHMKSEFDDAGIAWHSARARIDAMARTVVELSRRFSADHVPALVQSPHPPLLIGGNSDGVLRLAAEHADIVSFAGLSQAPGQPPGTFRLVDADDMASRVDFFRIAAGERMSNIELHLLIQDVTITDNRREVAQRWHEQASYVSVEQLLAAPTFLFGTVDQISAQIRLLRERYGFSYLSVFEPAMEGFSAVITALSAS